MAALVLSGLYLPEVLTEPVYISPLPLSESDRQIIGIGGIAPLLPELLDPRLRVIAEIIKSQTILLPHEIAENTFQIPVLSRVHRTLENGELHTLAVVRAYLRNFPETPLSCCCFRIDIIGNKYKHDRYLHTKGG